MKILFFNLLFVASTIIGSQADNQLLEKPADGKVLMPSQEILQQRFTAIGMDDFEEHTSLLSKLANTQKTPKEVADAFGTAKGAYVQKVGIMGVFWKFTKLGGKEPAMLATLLSDAPWALQELRKAGNETP